MLPWEDFGVGVAEAQQLALHMAAANDLPDAIITELGLKITSLDTGVAGCRAGAH